MLINLNVPVKVGAESPCGFDSEGMSRHDCMCWRPVRTYRVKEASMLAQNLKLRAKSNRLFVRAVRAHIMCDLYIHFGAHMHAYQLDSWQKVMLSDI